MGGLIEYSRVNQRCLRVSWLSLSRTVWLVWCTRKRLRSIRCVANSALLFVDIHISCQGLVEEVSEYGRQHGFTEAGIDRLIDAITASARGEGSKYVISPDVAQGSVTGRVVREIGIPTSPPAAACDVASR